MRVEVSPDLASIVTPAIAEFDGLVVTPHDPRMDDPIEATAARLRATAALEAVIASVRAMYRRLGIDPTKTRPSSEALLRRLRKGDPLPRVNSVVDICNWCSVETQLPFGLYDRDRIAGDTATLRRGREGEGYAGIRKEHVNVSGRLTIADAEGPFGNPTSDSARTRVTLETSRVVVVVYAPSDLDRAVREGAVALTESRVAMFARPA